jgi:hypothetical protein
MVYFFQEEVSITLDNIFYQLSTLFFNSISTLKKGNFLGVTKICQGLRGVANLFEYYPQMPLIAVTDFSGSRIKLEVIVTSIFPICSIS